MTGEVAQGTPRWTRDYVFDILREVGIHHIFGVPGTNEIPIIDGTSYPENEVRYIECLHENIAIGAAMGSARMTGKPGVLVVHVTPGIAHSIGNLFNVMQNRPLGDGSGWLVRMRSGAQNPFTTEVWAVCVK